MGWAVMILIGIFACGLLMAFGIDRRMWSVVGAGLMVGAIGYAVQGSPALPDHPVKADANGIEVDPGITDLRGEIFGRYGTDTRYLAASDALQRAGEPQAATQLLLAGIHSTGGDAVLWTELGTALSTHDGGYVSPAALLAFHHAAQLAPTSAGPPFFTGLAYVRAGDFADARPFWADALAQSPADAGYRPAIAIRLDMLDRYLTMAGGGE